MRAPSTSPRGIERRDVVDQVAQELAWRRYLKDPSDWRSWLLAMFPGYVRSGFASHHEEYWEWLWRITPDSDPEPFVGIWPRGGGKSTAVELGIAALGIRGIRSYALYVRETQDRADDSVQNIGSLLESAAVAERYPAHSRPLVNKLGPGAAPPARALGPLDFVAAT